MSAEVRSFVRPDGRCVARPDGRWTSRAAIEAVSLGARFHVPVVAFLDADALEEHEVLVEHGFVASRREEIVAVDIATALEALAHASLPGGVVARSAEDVDEDRLRLLDDELRQDVPGTSGWRSTAAEFHANTFEDPGFRRTTYLVAVDEAADEYLGLVRIWMNPQGPRLGFLGVRRDHRRRGTGSALLRRALEAALALGETEVASEYDVTNHASAAVARRIGARRIRTTVELVYEPSRGAVSKELSGVR